MRRVSVAVVSTLCLLVSCLPSPLAAQLDVLEPQYPRAFFFRSSEGLARAGRLDFAAWDRQFSRLQGIMGKCLDEEIPGTMVRNAAFFRRFKQRHPEQVVLLHFNGNACDPRFAEGHFPGHWIHRTAATITADVPAESGESVIQVENVGDFRLATGRYRNTNDDIALFAVGPDGHHDWTHCEQVQLLAVDHQACTIRVRRGCYGTQPLAFEAGSARAAAHMSEGPWGVKNHLLWFYNFTTHCPRDANGRTAADVLVERFARWYADGGPLHGLDGVEFDVMHHVTHGDTTGDGRLDNGVVNGDNRYGIGMIGFAGQLRERMGPEFLIQGDGALGPGGVRSQRAFRILNGIESEGWPNLRDWDFDDWSGGLNRQRFWQTNGYEPALSYVNHKWVSPVPDNPGRTTRPQVPFARHRLALAGAVLSDSAITYSFVPPTNTEGQIGIWDELIAGCDNQVAWLGRPLEPPRHLATQQPNLLPNADLIEQLEGNVTATLTADALKIEPRGNEANAVRFTLVGVPTRGSELFVSVNMRGQSPDGWPAEMARFAQVGVSSEIQSLLPPAADAVSISIRNRGPQPLDESTGASLRFVPRHEVNGVRLSAVTVHPPYKGVKGAVHWHSELQLRRESELRFAIGMGQLSPLRSDGVEFAVDLAAVENDEVGTYERLFQATTNQHEWRFESLSLSRWTGRRVRLRFSADCGPADNATTDHAAWGAVRIVPAGVSEQELTAPKSHMTWLNARPFQSTFFFREIRSKQVNLNFNIEGGAAVTIDSISVHAGPDVVVREFEHGLVLANPSLHKQNINLGQLYPGCSLRRLRGASDQDPQTNNGAPVGAAVSLGERDALFLLKTTP